MPNGQPDFPLSGTLIIQDQVSYLACDDPGGGNPIVYKLWRSDPPTGNPDNDAAQRATVYLEDGLNKGTHDELTIQNGTWPYPAPTRIICIIDAQ